MTDQSFNRAAVEPPLVAAPPAFVDRRVAFRRVADQVAHRETSLLARSLDALARDASAEARLAGVLNLLAETVGARRAAVLAGSHGDRRVAVARTPREPVADAEALAVWLDAWAPRPRSHRVAAGSAPILVVTADEGRADGVDPLAALAAVSEASGRHYACLPIPSAGEVALGFDFADPAGPVEVGDRLPPQLARHAAVVLALVTEQLATERDLAALRARDAERTRFVSTVAHELRTPLTGLGGYLDLILDGQVGDPADERDFLERSQQIVGSMGELVSDLLEVSRLESGTLRLELAPFSVAEVATRVVESLAPIALARGVTLETVLPPRLRSAVGDRRRVEQVLTNLLANALKFAPTGSTVVLDGWFETGVALVSVRDEGSGIEEEDRERIFERFYRLAGHERIGGTGLGLPIARDLARAMAGDLGVASVPGTGSAFVFALPGPAGAEASAVERALAEAVVDEESRLVRSAVLRSASPAPRPRLLEGADRSVDRRRDERPTRDAARPRLRTIDGHAPRSPDGAPA